MAINNTKIIVKSMKARLFSTVVTALTVAVAVALMLTLLSMRDSGRRAFNRGSGNMHLIISRDQDPLTAVLNGIFYANAPRNSIEWQKYTRQLMNPRQYLWDFAIPTALGDTYRGAPVMSTTLGFFTQFEPVLNEPWSLAEGRYFEVGFDPDSAMAPPTPPTPPTTPADAPPAASQQDETHEDENIVFEVVAGAKAAQRLGLSVGQRLHVSHGATQESLGEGESAEDHEHGEYEFEVVGVLNPTGSAHDRAIFTEITSAWILHAHDRRVAQEGSDIELTTEADLTPADRNITGIYAKVVSREGRQSSSLQQQTFFNLRKDPTITVADPVQQIGTLFNIVGNIDQILQGMAFVVMVSSGIGIMLALYNSMEQRRRQIAVLRVLGSSRLRIVLIVLGESVAIGAIGAIGGLGAGHFAAQATAGVLKERIGVVVEPALGLGWGAAVLGGAILLAAVAGVIPAISAYRTSVAKSLRPLG